VAGLARRGGRHVGARLRYRGDAGELLATMAGGTTGAPHLLLSMIKGAWCPAYGSVAGIAIRCCGDVVGRLSGCKISAPTVMTAVTG